MTTYSAGQFIVEVSPPSPQWLSLKTEARSGEPIELRFHPDDLPDLRYVLKRAAEHIAHNPAQLRK